MRTAFALLIFLAGLAGTAAAQDIELTIGIHRLQAEVARTPEARAHGLMNRRHLPDSRAMLFVAPQATRQAMWMRNTLIPLSVAFLDDRGVIVNIERMQPQTETMHWSAKAVRYALEVNGGWFERRGIRPGARVSGLDAVPDAE